MKLTAILTVLALHTTWALAVANNGDGLLARQIAQHARSNSKDADIQAIHAAQAAAGNARLINNQYDRKPSDK